MQSFSYENEFYLQVNENSFSYERLCSKTRFEKEVQDNLEMAYCGGKKLRDTIISGYITLRNFSCNFCRNKIARQVAWKIAKCNRPPMQFSHRPSKMATTFYEREIGGDAGIAADLNCSATKKIPRKIPNEPIIQHCWIQLCCRNVWCQSNFVQHYST